MFSLIILCTILYEVGISITYFPLDLKLLVLLADAEGRSRADTSTGKYSPVEVLPLRLDSLHIPLLDKSYPVHLPVSSASTNTF